MKCPNLYYLFESLCWQERFWSETYFLSGMHPLCFVLSHTGTKLKTWVWSNFSSLIGATDAFTGKTTKNKQRKERLVSEEGIQTPTSILIKQICHKSFYKCPVGGYRGWWKYPIHAASSPAGLKPRLLARLSVLTASDPPAICRVGWPALRGLCVLTLRRFNSETDKKKKNLKVKDPPTPPPPPPHNSCSSSFARHTNQTVKSKWQRVWKHLIGATPNFMINMFKGFRGL